MPVWTTYSIPVILFAEGLEGYKDFDKGGIVWPVQLNLSFRSGAHRLSGLTSGGCPGSCRICSGRADWLQSGSGVPA